MKRLNKLTAVLLSLAMCLSMSAPALAASFDDLQAAIDGTADNKEPGATVVDAEPAKEVPDTPEEPSENTPESDPVDLPEDEGHKNGALVRQDKDNDGNVTQNYYGYGWSSQEETKADGTSETKWYYAIEAHTKDGERVVVLLEDVDKGTGEASGIVIDQDGGQQNVTINMKGHDITGDKTGTVIEVKTDAELNLSNGTVSNGKIGIDVGGKLILDGVTVKDTGTGVNVKKGGTAQIKDSTITTNNTGILNWIVEFTDIIINDQFPGLIVVVKALCDQDCRIGKVVHK